ncbi:putative calcium-binding protein CML41 [Heracleum sosnowskyi]|uniref:Calcium-binding protein CML41 n=1 Tax=Heracleum sosnowskyi TaxID=360622 RepID=A0AAD8IFA6_9APIA|nr:putative calcium-binding protein CML41 [Heracleum sosnowskyi]
MEPSDVVPKHFGCFSHKSLRLSLNSFKSSKYSSSSNLSSPSNSRSPISPNDTLAPKIRTSIRPDDFLNQVFCRFDGNNDGKISALELRSYFASIGEYITHEEAQGVIDDTDSDGDNLIDFQDFKRLMTTRKGEDEGDQIINEEDVDIKGAFEMFEMEKGCGRITPKSLQRMLSRLGEPKSHDECVTMIQVFDMDGDGELDFNEFNQMMA